MIRFLASTLLGLLTLLPTAADAPLDVKIGAAQRVAGGPLVAQPRGAFGGGVYLVVWQDGWPGADANATIKAVRLQAGTLTPLDKQPVQFGARTDAQEAPAAAYADGVFLVVWQELRGGKHYVVRGARVDLRSGAVLGAAFDIAARPVSQCRPSVTTDGKTFFVAWQEYRGADTHGISAVRISTAGKLLDETPHDYAPLGSSPIATVSGGKLLVAWTVQQRNQAKTVAALADLATGRKSKDLGAINTCCGDALAAAGDGRGDFITAAGRAAAPDPWGWGGPGAVVLSRVLADGSAPESKLNYAYRVSNLCSRSVPNVVDAAVWKGSKTWDAGAPGGFPGTQDGLWPTGSPAVVHDGKGTYLFAWVKGRLTDDRLNVSRQAIWLRGMDGKSLAVTVADRKIAGELVTEETRPALIAGPPGEILLLCDRHPADADRQLIGRRIMVGE